MSFSECFMFDYAIIAACLMIICCIAFKYTRELETLGNIHRIHAFYIKMWHIYLLNYIVSGST